LWSNEAAMTSDPSKGLSKHDAAPAPPLLPRHDQMFPILTPAEIDRMRHFGTLRRYADGTRLFEAGKPGPGMFVVLSGHVAITQRDGLGHVTPIIDEGPGQFLAELSQLSGRASLVDGTAEGDVEALLIPTDQLRTLLVAEADLGERIMRAFILRRVGLIESGGSGPVLIGHPASGGMARLENFLRRNGCPYHLLDPDGDFEAKALIARLAPAPEELPLVVCPDGTVLRNPEETELARQLDMTGGAGRKPLYDVAIVGAGPAGLATAVYAASEGLSVIVLDARAYGGQAGASARIENYLGFPTGISGQALAGRAYSQAQKFGAEMMIPAEAKRLDCCRADGALVIELTGGQQIRARAVVVASGARYRRPDIENLARFEGHGVWYWASPIEARLCAAEEVMLVGGGNSAGQAAVFLSGFARRVRVVVRSDGLSASMSRYLIDRLAGTPNIELMPNTEIVALDGAPGHGLERVRWRNRVTGVETVDAIRNVFLFAGADPATSWLENCGVTFDKNGFVVTGVAGATPLESGVRGVFAVGDVRSGSVKRVGGAIGEGAQIVQALHLFLADRRVPELLPSSSEGQK
jgi:thioredoxin reductase (NADPH)